MRITPHQLRHSFSTLLLNAGAPIGTLQKLLGHAKIDTTLVYSRVYDRQAVIGICGLHSPSPPLPATYIMDTHQAFYALLVTLDVLGLTEHVEWWRGYYHFVRPHEGLRGAVTGPEVGNGGQRAQRYRSRTPAMAAGITGHRWTAIEFLRYPLPVG